MDQGQVEAWVRGVLVLVLVLASCGGAHEIDRDEEIAALGDRVDGSRFRVTVERLD